jgi:hypothetical protein
MAHFAFTSSTTFTPSPAPRSPGLDPKRSQQLPTGTLAAATTRQIDECNPQHSRRGYRRRHPDRGFSVADLQTALAGSQDIGRGVAIHWRRLRQTTLA